MKTYRVSLGPLSFIVDSDSEDEAISRIAIAFNRPAGCFTAKEVVKSDFVDEKGAI